MLVISKTRRQTGTRRNENDREELLNKGKYKKEKGTGTKKKGG